MKNFLQFWNLFKNNRIEKNTINLLNKFSNAGLPVYISDNKEICLHRISNHKLEKVIICSIGKSGTYLMSKILELCGYSAIGMHIADTYLMDTRMTSKEHARKIPYGYIRYVTCSEILLHVKNGQFMVSHLPNTLEIKKSLADFKILFLYRNLREVVCSVMLYASEMILLTEIPDDHWRNEKDLKMKVYKWLCAEGEGFFTRTALIADWINEPNAIAINYSDLIDINETEALDQLASTIKISKHIIQKSKRGALNSDTITKNATPTTLNVYWSTMAEQKFLELKGDELEKKLFSKSFSVSNINEYAVTI